MKNSFKLFGLVALAILMVLATVTAAQALVYRPYVYNSYYYGAGGYYPYDGHPYAYGPSGWSNYNVQYVNYQPYSYHYLYPTTYPFYSYYSYQRVYHPLYYCYSACYGPTYYYRGFGVPFYYSYWPYTYRVYQSGY